MISAAPLYSGVHNWTSGDCIRMCGINEDRRTPLSDQEAKTGSSERLGSQECCVSSGLSKLELAAVKNCIDARMQDEEGSVEEKTGHRSDAVPLDPQTLESTDKPVISETSERAAPLTDKGDLRMLDSLLSGASDPEIMRVEAVRTSNMVTEKQMEIPSACLQCAETENSGKQKTALNAGLQVSGQPLEGVHSVASSSFSTLTPFSMSRVCYSTSQGSAVQKSPLSFQPGTVITQSQPLMYIPPASCRQPLSVTTLPTTLGVTPTLTFPVLPSYLQERCLSGILAPQELRSYPYTSSVGRPLTSEHKVVAMEINRLAGTTPSHPPSCSNNVTSTVSNLSCADASLPSITKQTSSPHPALPVSRGSPVPLLGLSSYSRPPCHSDQHTDGASGSFSPLKSPPQLEREMVSPQDCTEMPLDLSSKSKRQRLMPPNQRKTPPMPVLTPVHTSGKAILSTVLSKSDCNNYTSSSVTPVLRAPSPFVVFPEILRNGEPGSSQLLSASGSWVKNSAALISTIPGTYVGVANPVPASLLLKKDSNMGLSSDVRHLAKQEPISIVDQGEPKNPAACGKKGSQTTVEGQQTARRYVHGRIPSGTTLCSAKEFSLWNAHGHGAVYPKCPVSGKLSSPQVLPVAWPPYHQTSVLSIGASATGQLHASQITPPNVSVSVTEYSSCPSIHPSETSIPPQKATGEKKLEGQQRITRPLSLEQELPAKGWSCDPLLKSSNDPFLTPVTQGSALFNQTNAAEAGGILSANVKGKKESPPVNSTSEALNCDPCSRDTLIQADGPKTTCSQKPKGDAKPKSKVLGTLANQQRHRKVEDQPVLSQSSNRKDSETDVCGGKTFGSLRKGSEANVLHCVQEVDLSKVKIEKEDYEDFACSTSYSRAGWSPADMPGIYTDMKIKVKARIKRESGARCKSRCREELQTRGAQKKLKCKTKEADKSSSRLGKDPCKRKWRKQQLIGKRCQVQPDCEKGFAAVRQKRRRRKAIKTEPEYFQQEEDYPEKKSKNSFQDFIPVVLTSRTRSQSGNLSSHFSGVSRLCDSSLHDVLPTLEEDEEKEVLSKRRRLRKGYRMSRYRARKTKDGPVFERNSRRLRGSRRTGAAGKLWGALEDEDEDEDSHVKRRKRRRQKNRKYQNGEYLTERVEEKEMPYCYRRRRAKGDFRVPKRKLSPVGRALEMWTRGRSSPRDSRRHSEFKNSFSRERMEVSLEHASSEKPSGKRKCKTKHLGGNSEEEVKGKALRWGQSPRSRTLKSPRKSRDTWPPCKGRRNSACSSPGSSAQHIPPEARRLIVNKNAGETLLQRAARLGYKDVVLYCLNRDLSDVNHRDNAGYTALHEACSRGWTDILQILLDHGANVNCSAQDGTRPIHDAVVNDNLETVWLLLSYGADPTLATYSGQTAMKLASSEVMRGFLSDYLSDLRGRSEGDPRTSWDFYSSAIFEGKEEIGADIFLNPPDYSEKAAEPSESDSFLFEFSDKPFIPCYNIQVFVSHCPSNWFLFSDVLKRLKISSRIFQARFPQFEIASLSKKEFHHQMTTSQLLPQPEGLEMWPQDGGETVELVRYEPELLQLLGSDVEFQADSS